MKQEKDSTLPPIKSISHLPYITFFENYWEIYRYNKPTLKSFHKCFFHTFNNILPNPLDIYKPEIYKKISSHFKITPLLEYLSLESYDPALFEKKLEKSDYSILFRLLKDLLMILERNTKKLKEEVPLNENKWNTLELISHNPFPAQSELTQTDELAMGQKENNSFNGENFNVMVLEIVEFAETTCFIVPNFSGISTFSFMEQSLNSIMQSFIENREERLDFGSFLEKVVPIDIKQLIIKLEDEEGEGVMLEEEGIVKTLLECFFTEKNFQMKRIEVLVDKMFLFEFSALSQLCKVANLGLALGKNFFILPENKHNFYEEMINNKKNIISTMTPSVSKEPYKKLFMKMNYNYLLAFEWISQKKFKFQLIFKEIGKEFWGNWINLDSLEEYKSPLKLFHMFLIKLQAETDECELNSKFPTFKAFRFESNFVTFFENTVKDDPEKIMTSFLRNQLSEILLEDNGAFFPPETDCSFSKNIFAINLRKIALKYESWLHKDSYMDIKEFSLIIEVGKTPGLLMMKMKIPDYSMTIENGDELLFFSQEIATKFPEVLLDIDEMRKNVLKTVVQYNSNSSIFSKILETIDLLLIISVSFYLASIRSIFYYKPSKDSEKYGIFVRMMRELWEKHKKELTFFEKWKKIKQICSNKINFDF